MSEKPKVKVWEVFRCGHIKWGFYEQEPPSGFSGMVSCGKFKTAQLARNAASQLIQASDCEAVFIRVTEKIQDGH